MLIRFIVVGVIVMAVAFAIHFAAAAYAPARTFVVVAAIYFSNNLALTFVIVIVVAGVDFIEFMAIFTIDFTYLFASAVVAVRLMQLLVSNTLRYTVLYVNSIVVIFIAFVCCNTHFQAKHFTIIALTNCVCRFVVLLLYCWIFF